MQRIELEAFGKAFILFFISMSIMAGMLYWGLYSKALHDLDETILSKMRLCSFDLTCKEFSIDFAPKENAELYTLHRNNEGLYSYFPISQSEAYVLKLHYDAAHYHQRSDALMQEHLTTFSISLLLIALLSSLFSFYALHPLRHALLMTREFVRDILHDFNTPLSVLRLNAALLHREYGDNKKLSRIEQSVETILSLQENLKSYLEALPQHKERFDLSALLAERIALIEKLYPQLHFELASDTTELTCNKDAFIRIVDNLLSNAAKYNRPEGIVRVTLDSDTLRVSDTGHGIKAPKKVFERFYTESTNGYGIGLHIVKKLCDAMGITINVDSTPNKGSHFKLDLSALTQH